MVVSAALRFPAIELDPEAILLARLRAGDESAFEELVRANGARLLATARRFLRLEEDARDTVQEALLHAFRALPRFAGEARLSTWLHRIVINAALMRLRARKRRPEESIDDLLPHFDAEGHRLGDGPEPVLADGALERAELRARVRRAIAALPEGYRTVLELRDVEDLDTNETARLLGISEAAVKTRLHRARQALRTLIARELEDAGGPGTVRIEEWIAIAAS
jgi:RNA polymerase sigma-70 factor (ECF subfamily)